MAIGAAGHGACAACIGRARNRITENIQQDQLVRQDTPEEEVVVEGASLTLCGW
ncbi:MAG TPA: hypothetical protein VFT59_03630 [Candidatus Saccharimonadales bacterium]|nr:hypothetical protein [Candidatus Saccharimonadales bacterium]